MSDNAAVLIDGYSSPRAWVYTIDDEIILNNDGTPIVKYLTKFEYVYDEESDDRCELTFQFDNVKLFDGKYVQKDTKIMVQWGYLVNGKQFIKSPKRKVAVRDIQRKYLDKKLTVTLLCTDLVSYLKLYKTQTVKRYDNTEVKKDLATLDDLNKHFMDYVFELAEGSFIPTITSRGKGILKDKSGTVRAFTYDEKTGERTFARENTAIAKQIYEEFHVSKITMGKSKAIPNAIEDRLKWINSQTGGQYQMDTTDDEMNMFQRNYKQDIFKSWTFGGNTGELIEFSSKTDTRKTSKNTAATSNVNPYTKEIETNQVDIADTGDGLETENGIKLSTGVIDENQVKAWIKQMRDLFEYNFRNPDNQKDFTGLSYISVLEESRLTETTKFKPNRISVDAKELLNIPEFMDLLQEANTDVKAKYLKEQALLGYLTDKVQKKNTASAKIIGDPEVIKGKIYGFSNMYSTDNGRWYCIRASHSITTEDGYMTDMDLIREPSPVAVNKNEAKEEIKPKENPNPSVNGDDGSNEWLFDSLLKDVQWADLYIYREDRNKDGEAEFYTGFDDSNELVEQYIKEGRGNKIDEARDKVKQLNAENDYEVVDDKVEKTKEEQIKQDKEIEKLKKKAVELKIQENASNNG